MCADAPDTSKQAEIAMMAQDLSKEELDFFKQIYADGADDRALTSQTAREVSGLQLEAMRGQMGLAEEFQQDRQPYRQLERQIVDNAMAFNTEDKREEMAGAARSDVAQAFAGQRGQVVRQMGRMGVNPASRRGMALSEGLAADEALATASSAAQARMKTETMGNALMLDAAQLGKGNVSGLSTTAGIALNSGNSAVGNANVPNQVNAGGAGIMGTAYSGARQGLSQASGIYNQITALDQSTQAANDSAAGGLAGSAMAAGAMIFV